MFSIEAAGFVPRWLRVGFVSRAKGAFETGCRSGLEVEVAGLLCDDGWVSWGPVEGFPN